MERTFRMTPPPTTGGDNPITINGRMFSATVGSTVDMLERDALLARDNNWTMLGMVGTTAQRPSPLDDDGVSLLAGQPRYSRYIDTTLGKMIAFDSVTKVWRDPVTGAAV